ncbi:MAG: hypothetical protein ACRD4Q_00835 [Candidatus Acidiferrales bacterium]
MRKIHIGLAVFAVFAFSAVVSSSALAASAYLLNGAEIKELIFTEATGELLLEDTGIFGKPDVLCSGIFDGMIEPGGVIDEIESVLELNKELLEGPGGTDLIECEAHSTCTNPVDVIAINLPWATEVMLTAGGLWYDLINAHAGGGLPGYTIDCNSIIGLIEDTCTGNTSNQLVNEAGGLLGEFFENETEGISPPGGCTQGGAGTGLVVGNGFITSGSGTLTVS